MRPVKSSVRWTIGRLEPNVVLAAAVAFRSAVRTVKIQQDPSRSTVKTNGQDAPGAQSRVAADGRISISLSDLYAQRNVTPAPGLTGEGMGGLGRFHQTAHHDVRRRRKTNPGTRPRVGPASIKHFPTPTRILSPPPPPFFYFYPVRLFTSPTPLMIDP